jgi:glycosyltransferase involved in cell wall biosynthesis
MTKPLTFSVGIPAYNQGEFLEETILSLLNQTRPPDEIVISDHYSTDNTPEIIEKYAGHVRGVKPPRGANLTGQYNFTLTSQTCDWITLLSSDDVARPNFCEVLLRGASRRDDAALVRAGWENIDGEGRPLGQHYFLRMSNVVCPPETVRSQQNGPKVCFASFAIRRTAYRDAGPIPESVESLADWALFLQLAPFGSFLYENEVISGYRVGHDGNKFRSRFGMWIRDEQRMFYDVMPLAAQRAGMTDTAWIDKASRANFLRYVTAAYDEFAPSERAALYPILEPWAQRVSGQPILESFVADHPLPFSLGNAVERGKQMLRPFAQKMHAALRSGSR